jgi:glycosyltransferase involved in cell wall biosynthesis
MVSELPWVSMDVGNTPYLKGGIIIKNSEVDDKGYKKYNKKIIDSFGEKITRILSDAEDGDNLKREGYEEVEEKYNWKNICEQYYNLFIL